MSIATPSAGKPRFKQELVAELVEDGGARFIDVMDPDSGNIFRFYEVEYAIACAMDGERDVAGIVKWAQDELGVTPTPSEVTRVISTLGDLGYLAGAETADLAKGIVVGQATASATAADDIPLGAAGSMGATATAVAASTIEAPDLMLGKPGAPPVVIEPSAPVEDFALGRAGASTSSPSTSGDSIPVSSDVSLDLSDNMKIGLGDVKEAVRASRVMSAVEVPPDLMAVLEDKKPEPVVEAKPEAKKPEPKVEAKKPEPVAAKPPEAKPPEAKKPEPKVEAKKPEPKKPDAETKRPVAPTPTAGSSSKLVILLVLVLLAAGGFFVWKYVLNKPAEGTDPGAVGSAVPVAPIGSAGSTPAGSAVVIVKPAASEPVAAKLATETPAATDIKPLAANVIESIEDVAGKPVVKGAVIAKMTGAKKLEDELKELAKGVTRDQTAIDTATKAKTDAGSNADGVKKADDTIKDKTAEMAKKTDAITAKKAELEKLVVVAPADGTVTFTAAGKIGTRTGDALATLGAKPVLSATFALKGGTPPALGATVTLARKADNASLSCTVTESKPDAIKVACDPATAKVDDDVAFTPTP